MFAQTSEEEQIRSNAKTWHDLFREFCEIIDINNEKCNLDPTNSELSTGRMDPRVWSCRVTILQDFGWSGRVWSALQIYKFLLIISWYLNRYESSNTTFE